VAQALRIFAPLGTDKTPVPTRAKAGRVRCRDALKHWRYGRMQGLHRIARDDKFWGTRFANQLLLGMTVLGLGSAGILVSHPFAQNAKEWGTL
jgi:hypothetical protein